MPVKRGSSAGQHAALDPTRSRAGFRVGGPWETIARNKLICRSSCQPGRDLLASPRSLVRDGYHTVAARICRRQHVFRCRRVPRNRLPQASGYWRTPSYTVVDNSVDNKS